MPLSRDDEVFVEKCFQRSLLVSHTSDSRSPDLLNLRFAGTREADVFQWNPYSCLAEDRRDMSRRPRILHVDRLVDGGPHWG